MASLTTEETLRSCCSAICSRFLICCSSMLKEVGRRVITIGESYVPRIYEKLILQLTATIRMPNLPRQSSHETAIRDLLRESPLTAGEIVKKTGFPERTVFY